MTNAGYRDISQYRDVESLNYYEILLSQGKTPGEALDILSAHLSRKYSRMIHKGTEEDSIRMAGTCMSF